MQLHNVQQGSKEWHELRANCFTASEASAMMGASKYKSRDQLLAEKATGITEEITPAKQALFDRGHATEEAARPFAEIVMGEELYPATGTKEVEGLKLLASFDGITFAEDLLFEHKLWNEKLSVDVMEGELTPHYYWQLEHQLLVSGGRKVLFMASDGSEDNQESCWYVSKPERRAQLIVGWQQFNKDLQGYQPKQEVIEAKAQPLTVLPSLFIQLTGNVGNTNLVEYQGGILSYIEQINENLETDQDFANAEATVKQLDAAEKDLKAVEKQALSQTADIETLFKSIEHIGNAMRTKRLALNKLVKSRKEAIKLQIVTDGKLKLSEHIHSINSELPYAIPTLSNTDFGAAIKGKRTLKSMNEAVNDLLATAKIEAEHYRKTMGENFASYQQQAKGFEFLFNDLSDLILMEGGHLKLIISSRINEHKVAEEKRLEAERERIRAEEQRKAEAEAQRKAQAEEAERQAAVAEAVEKSAEPTAQNPASSPELVEQAAAKVEATTSSEPASAATAATVSVHVKVTDRGNYEFKNANGETLCDLTEQYVPGFFPGEHYGDYLILEIELATGRILNWQAPTNEDVLNAVSGEE